MLVERFYNYDEIKAAGDCLAIAKDLGIEVHERRCKASWRGGENESSVSLSPEGWHDFGTGESGTILDLVAKVKFNGDMQQAQQYLGDYLNLEPKLRLEKDPNRKSRADKLLEQGYKLVKEYNYHDLDGTIKHTVCRFEHPEKKKEFVQKTPEHWGVKGTRTLLYRLPEWISSAWVCICEGEKDVDNLCDLGFPATTNAAGAANWEDYYNDWLKGKSVIIFEDNDTAGKRRSSFLAWTLKDIALNIRIISFPELKDGGDVSDWLALGHTQDELFEKMKSMPELDKQNIKNPGEDYIALQVAKEANKIDFRNFIPVKDEEGNITKKPRQINDIIRELHARFLGFPRKVGEALFDHNRDTGEIEYFTKPASLFAWIARKSKRSIEWGATQGCVTKEEFFEGILATAKRYEAISCVPDFPQRDDVYYTHKTMPSADPERQYFEKLISYFNPAGNEYRTLLKAFFAAPLFYAKGISKPAWIIDSEDGAGSGKTSIVELCANLYKTEPLKSNVTELKNNFGEVIKRLVSATGRQRRIFLLDNVHGNFYSSEYADLVTAASISGRPSYGRGEETRPNNLVYVITANSATVDNDIADRSYYILIEKGNRNPTWKRDVLNYINAYRCNILADIIAILESNAPFYIPSQTRFPEFESQILMPLCGDQSEFEDIIEMLKKAKTESNVEEDMAGMVYEGIKNRLINLHINADDCAFIRSEVAEKWMKEILPNVHPNHTLQLLRNMARNKFIKEIDAKTFRYPHHGNIRRRGFLWNYSQEKIVKIIGLNQQNNVGLVL